LLPTLTLPYHPLALSTGVPHTVGHCPGSTRPHLDLRLLTSPIIHRALHFPQLSSQLGSLASLPVSLASFLNPSPLSCRPLLCPPNPQSPHALSPALQPPSQAFHLCLVRNCGLASAQVPLQIHPASALPRLTLNF
jgi:hypothetical protein